MAAAIGLAHTVPASGNLEERSAALEEALQRATEADHRKGESLAILAHELRNHLAPIRNSLEIMRTARADANLRAWAHATVERQVLQMARLVDDLLDVNRIDRDQLELKKRQVNLGLSLEHVLDAIRSTPEAAERTLALTLPPQPLFLEADAARLTQVFGNLLGNACKYTNRGGRITVAVEQQGSDVVVRVTDNGIGIPRGLLEHVFERFMQVDRSMERTRGGLGIGLALARQLVELHGGTITAHSEGPGLGSEFIVRLPILSNRPLVLTPPTKPSQPVQVAPRRRSGPNPGARIWR